MWYIFAAAPAHSLRPPLNDAPNPCTCRLQAARRETDGEQQHPQHPARREGPQAVALSGFPDLARRRASIPWLTLPFSAFASHRDCVG
jgi:hypothetical protein